MTDAKEPKETKLSVREFIFILAALVSAMATWAPKFLPSNQTLPEVTVLKNELEDIRDKETNNEEMLRDLRNRMNRVERDKGYNDDDPELYNRNARKRNH